jgi:Cu2+-containing amine oxidase
MEFPCYIRIKFYTADEKNYTFKLHDNLAANIHQHIFNFKADLDIKGTSNRFVTAEYEKEYDRCLRNGIPMLYSNKQNAFRTFIGPSDST